MHFDSGCKHETGSVRYIGWDSQGKCIDGRSICYQDVPRKTTHNAVAMWAARVYLEFIEAQGYLNNHKTIVIRGDNQLIMNFMLRKYKPGPDQLYEQCKQSVQDGVSSFRSRCSGNI